METMFWHNSIVLPPPWASTSNKGPKIHMLRTPAPWYTSHRIQSGNFNTKKQKQNEKTVVQKQPETKESNISNIFS